MVDKTMEFYCNNITGKIEFLKTKSCLKCLKPCIYMCNDVLLLQLSGFFVLYFIALLRFDFDSSFFFQPLCSRTKTNILNAVQNQ